MTQTKTKWHKIDDRPQPPSHTRLVFLCDNGRIYSGNMCYGLHDPWFCTHSVHGDTVVLNDHRIRVTHWTLFNELEKEIRT